jgi:hypothetical protein
VVPVGPGEVRASEKPSGPSNAVVGDRAPVLALGAVRAFVVALE